jgi:phenylpropionate dioxygenase-like ring-hydroxylating dioxygenase large terminal subunit
VDAALEDRIRTELRAEAERTEPPGDAVPVPPIPVQRYRDEAFTRLEHERVWTRTWLFVGHESELAAPGSYRLFTRSGSPILVVRGHDGVVRAFYNSCRHRGAPVVRDECGVAKRLTCQYHSWSYDTAGELRAVPDARSFAGLDQAALGLVPVRCETWQGFVFVN